MQFEKLSALSIGELIATRQVKAIEVMEYFLGRIDKFNPDINAIVDLHRAEALIAARQVDIDLAAGKPLGRLAGVPFVLKDFLPSKKGWYNTHGGVPALRMMDTEDSEVTKAACREGAIAIGKTNAPSFGFSGTTFNTMYGATKNPFNTEYNSGGSSGGTAAAVAAGLVPFGEGGDGGGSIRIPSAWCGCFGFKSTAGLIPSVCRPDAWTATHPFCTTGVITRNVMDSAYLTEQMQRFNPRDPYSVPMGQKLVRNIENVRAFKIAVTLDFDLYDTCQEVKDAICTVAYRMQSLGFDVEFVPFSFKHTMRDFAEMWCTMISVDTSMDLLEYEKQGLTDLTNQVPSSFLKYNTAAYNLDVPAYKHFNDMRTDILDGFENVFEEFDFVLAPVTSCTGILNKDGITYGPGGANRIIGYCETFMVNFIGYPAASVPSGIHSSEGLPIGFQLIGPKYSDAEMLALAHAYENAFPWSYIE